MPWAASITVRTAIDTYRRERNYKEQTDLKEFDHELEEVDLDPGSMKVVDEMNAEEVRELIYSLPELERMVFVLYEWEGYKHQEIAEKLDCSERSSKRYLQRAKEGLKKKLRAKDGLKKVI